MKKIDSPRVELKSYITSLVDGMCQIGESGSGWFRIRCWGGGS